MLFLLETCGVSLSLLVLMGPPFAPRVVMGALMLPRFLSAFGLCLGGKGSMLEEYFLQSIQDQDSKPKLNWSKSLSRYGTHSPEIFRERVWYAVHIYQKLRLG